MAGITNISTVTINKARYLSATPTTLFIGTTDGNCYRMDRATKALTKLTNSIGSVRDITSDGTYTYFFTGGIYKYLRVHNTTFAENVVTYKTTDAYSPDYVMHDGTSPYAYMMSSYLDPELYELNVQIIRITLATGVGTPIDNASMETDVIPGSDSYYGIWTDNAIRVYTPTGSYSTFLTGTNSYIADIMSGGSDYILTTEGSSSTLAVLYNAKTKAKLTTYNPANGIVYPRGFDGTNFYFETWANNRIYQMNVNTLVTKQIDSVIANVTFAVASTGADYTYCLNNGVLKELKKADGTLTNLYTGTTSAYDRILADANNVYATNGAGNKIICADVVQANKGYSYVIFM